VTGHNNGFNPTGNLARSVVSLSIGCQRVKPIPLGGNMNVEEYVFKGYKEYGRFIARDESLCAHRVVVRARGGLCQCPFRPSVEIGGYRFCKRHARKLAAA
jgi:hypothetical protein